MIARRVAVIGGGPGGLMLTHLLNQVPSCECTIFEASSRLGGKIVTRQFASAPVRYEAGAAELYDYSQIGPDPLRELVAELGLPTRPMIGSAVILDGRIVRTLADVRREFGDATHDALKSFRRKARNAISPQEYYDSDWKEDNADPMARRQFHTLLQTVPDETARRLIQVTIHSDLATEPHQTNAAYGLQNFLMNEPGYMRLYTVDGGIERIPQELAKRISARVRLNHRVAQVEKTEDNRYRVISRSGTETSSEVFDFVVAALPNNWLPSVDWAGPVLSNAMHRHHAHYDYPAHYLRVSILFRKPFWRNYLPDGYFMLDAFGGCCVYDETSRGVTHEYGVLGWLIGGEAALNLNNLDDATLTKQMLDSLPDFLQHGRDDMMESRVHRWIGSVNGLPGGRPMLDPDVRHQPEPTEHPGLFVIGDYLFDSTLNGVLDSAELVADWIAEEIAEIQAAGTTGPNNIIAPAKPVELPKGNPRLPSDLQIISK
ncbi:flavin monoamine oxidase family protein [Zavarzinella formosa]|uniref:flavin monoamine oxidase family protein n=1 Tax=Zavarzinella formosa TaxID=360055 RepID=UPI00037A3623|nr:FAD-dependent oxidoreductase [Zavarzinella formosa]